MNPEGRITLTRYTIEQQARHPNATGQLSGLINAIATAVKMIANQVNKGSLIGGQDEMTPREGVPAGHTPHKFDLIANEAFTRETEWTGNISGIVSEEMEAPLLVPARYKRGKYLLVFDPIDGSSNLDVNISVGSIFSVLRAPNPGSEPALEDFLQPGVRQVAAGFALYGPATMLVLTTGDGVDGFTLDRDIGAFILTHPQMRIAEDTTEFAINASNSRFWEPPVRRYVDECLQGQTGPRAKDFNMRWIASLVAETYRILTRGGVFMYPRDTKDPSRHGRLRLLYEANPISFIVEQAGGAATTGRNRILDVQPGALHEPVPVIFGSKNEVERIVRYHDENERGLDKAYTSPLLQSRSLLLNS